MDPTRFSLELTPRHGASSLEGSADTPPGMESTSPLNTTDMDDWLDGLHTEGC
jgi:hypothetical protein